MHILRPRTGIHYYTSMDLLRNIGWLVLFVMWQNSTFLTSLELVSQINILILQIKKSISILAAS